MNILFWRRQDLTVGDRFDGAVAWCSDPTSGAPKPAFYPGMPDGSLNFEIPCSWVEANPGVTADNSGWFVVADFVNLPTFDELPKPNVSLNDPNEPALAQVDTA